MAEPSTAAELIDALLAGGEPVDEGSFSIDATAAAAKLLGFQYLDRSAYLIPIAEAGAGLDAQRVSLTTRGADLRITFEGVHVRDAAEWLASAFRRRRGEGDGDRRANRALARLGVGLDMALGHASIDRIAISYSTDQHMLVAEYRPDRPPRLSRRDPERPGTLQIFVDRPWTARLAAEHPVRGELDQLRAAVRHAQTRFEIDGELVSNATRLWEFVSRGHGEGYRYECGIEAWSDSPSAIELHAEGICVDTIAGSHIAFRAVVQLDEADRDISQAKVIHDEVVTAALEAVETARSQALLALQQQDARWSGATRPSQWSEARVDRILGRPERAPVSPPAHVDGPVTRAFLRLTGAAMGLGIYIAGIRLGQACVEAFLQRELWSAFVGFVVSAVVGSFGGMAMSGVVENEKVRIVIFVILFVLGSGLAIHFGVS